jgi:hypothetical protein
MAKCCSVVSPSDVKGIVVKVINVIKIKMSCCFKDTTASSGKHRYNNRSKGWLPYYFKNLMLSSLCIHDLIV